jgi:heme/copper-type cytochrome/quinol oxidase subunit 3
MRPERAVLDVSELPTVVFGHRNHMWWGIVAFMAIEGTTLAVCAASYLYLRRNFSAWPPPTTPLPDVLVPSLGALVMIASLAPAAWAVRAAHRFDLAALRRALVAMSLFGVALLAIRVFELRALNTHFDSNAYGSAAWLVVATHATLLLLDVADSMAFAAILFTDRVEKKHFTDAVDNSHYWYFMVLSWLPLYVLVYLSPRWV